MTIGIYQLKDSGGMVYSNVNVPSVAHLFQNADAVVEEVGNKTNLFYSMGSLKKGVDPVKRQFESQDCIPFDIDDADLERTDDYIKAVLGALNLEYSKTGIINSGNGLQFIVQTESPIIKKEDDFKKHRVSYKKLCEKIDQNLTAMQLPGYADTSVWSLGRVMRVPNTINKKKDGTKHAKAIQSIIEPQTFSFTEVKSVTPIKRDVPYEARPQTIDTNAVLTGCEFLKWAKENQDQITYEQWFQLCAVTYTIDPSGDLTHLYSKGYSKYDPEEVDKQLDYLESERSNVTCERIESVWDRCSSCPNFCKVYHPTEIKEETFITTKATGFRNLSEKGVPKDPNFQDLYKYFTNDTTYLTVKKSKDLYAYKQGKWGPYYESEAKNFAMRFLDKSRKFERDEFFDHIRSNNLKDIGFFEHAGSGKVNFTNGVLDLETGVLNPHSPDYGFRWQLPFAYDPAADCPVYSKIMKQNTQGDQDLLDLLQEVGGYIVSGVSPQSMQKFFLLYGEGSNGKTSYAAAIQECVGKENISAAEPKVLAKPEGRSALVGKLFNYYDEVPKDMMKSDNLKYLATGAPISYRNLYSDSVVESLPVKLMFSANELPKNNDASHGMMRKIVILPFMHLVKEEDRIPLNKLQDQFREEAAGLFNHFYQGYTRLMKNNKFTTSKAVDKMLGRFKVESDSVHEWADLNLIQKEGKLGSRIGYDHYREWCVDNGKRPKSSTGFGKTMSKLYSESKIGKRKGDRKSYRYYSDLAIVDAFTGEEIEGVLF